MWWRPDRRRDEVATPPQPDLSDVEFVIGQTSDWIRGADTKAGLLLGALVVLLGWLSSAAGHLRSLWSGHPDNLPALIALAACVALLAVAIGLLVGVLVPRRSSPPASRYAWPWISRVPVEEVLALTSESRRREAWLQAKQLAGIAARKHSLFTAAVWVSAGSTTCFLVWSVLRT